MAVIGLSRSTTVAKSFRASALKYLMRARTTFNEVLVACNSAPGNVRKYKDMPLCKKTRRYVRDVPKFYAATSSNEP
ncbi:MAG TPA: hypothetical protein VEC35_08700 [Noviherbaspirillum sp.]|nr:hypothetical protein [Noviherbaspirillum sp.]